MNPEDSVFNKLVEYAFQDKDLPEYAKKLIADLYLRLYGHEYGKDAERDIRDNP